MILGGVPVGKDAAQELVCVDLQGLEEDLITRLWVQEVENDILYYKG